MQRILLISTLAALMTVSTPSVAAPDYRETTGTVTRNAAFIGAQARLSLGSSKPAVPVARLMAGMTNLSLHPAGSLVNRPIGTTFELGFSRRGRSDFYVGGQRLADVQRRLGIASAGVAFLAIGGMAVVGATLGGSSASDSSNAPQPPKKPDGPVCLGIGICPG